MTWIGRETFANCGSLQSIVIPDSVTEIGNSAFSRCERLESLSIGSGVTSIGENAFLACRELSEVTIPARVTQIGEDAFAMCAALENAVFAEPNGWSIGGDPVSPADLSDPAVAAEMLSRFSSGAFVRE